MSAGTSTASPIRFIYAIPILRMFSVEKTKDFYCNFLGFTLDWEHTFVPGAPVYMQVSRAGLRLHLSEHHGDGSPGVHVHVEMKGVEEFHREVNSTGYRYMHPGLEDTFYGSRAMIVIDPTGNRISFNEFKEPRE